MIRILAAGLWGVLVASGANFLAVKMELFSPAHSSSPDAPKVETVGTGIMRVPIMANETPSGYVLIDLSIDYDATTASAFASKMKSIAVDEAFRTVYEKSAADFRDARKSDLSALLSEIGQRIDKRIGSSAIKDVRINEFMFAPPRKPG